MSKLATWTVVFVAMGVGLVAEAQAPVELDVERAAGAEACPSAVVIRREVSARLGYDPFREDAERVVDVAMGAADDRVTAEIVVRRGPEVIGRRVLGPEGSDCTQLAEDLLLALTLAIDPVAATRGPDPADPAPGNGAAGAHAAVANDGSGASPTDAPPDPASFEPASSEPASSDPGPRDASPPAPAPTRFEIGAAAIGQLGSAPIPTFALGARVGIVHRWLAAEVGVRGSIPVDVPLPREGTSGSIDTFLVTADLGLCGRVEGFELCARGAFGGLVVRAEGLPDARTGSAPYVGLGGSVAYVWSITDTFGLRPSLTVLAHAVRTHVQVGDDTVWALEPVAGTLALELFHRG
ncbi:MAG TPA: hypothetical protein RMH99_14450 [Sandaracinaceae bacterium LLY-WYZ-13_1]|nr:hypothetical protein [Sandaracinaceae bacterium LLY-WYZ-13_1]